MAAFPSYADYEEYDGDGPSGRPRRVKRAPRVPMPGAPPQVPDAAVGPPDPYAPRALPAPPPSASTARPNPEFDRAYNAQADPNISPAAPVFPPGPGINPRVGIPTAGLNKTGRALAEIEVMRKADPASELKTTEWGYEYEPPERSPSRLRQALMGALQGALAGAAQTGTLGGLLGGAGTGAAAGGINPRLMLALKRDQDIRRAQGQLSDDLKLEQQQAQIGNIGAQTEENRAQAEAARRGPQRYVERVDGVYEISNEYPNGRRVGNIPAEARTQSANRHYFEREDGVWMTDDAHPQGVKLESVPGKPAATDSTQGAIAAEGAEEAAQADTRIAEIEAEIKHLNDYPGEGIREGRKSIAQKEAMWRTEAARRYKDALSTYVEGVDAKPELKDFYEQVKAEDEHFQSGVYDETVKNTTEKEARLAALNTELTGLKKERRGGAAKSKRIAPKTGAGKGKQKSSDGRYHYTLDEVKRAAGDRYEEVLKALQARTDVVIDQ